MSRDSTILIADLSLALVIHSHGPKATQPLLVYRELVRTLDLTICRSQRHRKPQL